MDLLKRGQSARSAVIWLGTEIDGKTPAQMMRDGDSRKVWEILKKSEK
mgnify:CR=1 FL=1